MTDPMARICSLRLRLPNSNLSCRLWVGRWPPPALRSRGHSLWRAGDRFPRVKPTVASVFGCLPSVAVDTAGSLPVLAWNPWRCSRDRSGRIGRRSPLPLAPPGGVPWRPPAGWLRSTRNHQPAQRSAGLTGGTSCLPAGLDTGTSPLAAWPAVRTATAHCPDPRARPTVAGVTIRGQGIPPVCSHGAPPARTAPTSVTDSAMFAQRAPPFRQCTRPMPIARPSLDFCADLHYAAPAPFRLLILDGAGGRRCGVR
jgi:hypothetical protein